MTSIRDMNCGNDVAMMDKLGRFEREFAVYGAGFIQAGQVRYLISSRQEKLCQFIDQSAAKAIYPTPMAWQLISTAVPSGTQADIILEAKLDLAARIQAMYSRPFFEAVAQLGQVPANDSARPLLEAEREKLIGVFDREALGLFDGLVRQALADKVLTEASFTHFQGFIEKIYRQMADDVVIKRTFSRTFSGFLYRTPQGELAYFADAQKTTVWSRRSVLQLAGCLVTPIFSKTYWFDYDQSVKSIRQQFDSELRQRLDRAYWAQMVAISQLPAAVTAETFGQIVEPIVNELNDAEIAALTGYGHRYHALAVNCSGGERDL